RSRAPMPSRRWDPGIGVGVCLATIWQDHITDSGNQDFYLVTLGRDLGIDKDYRKFEETLDWVSMAVDSDQFSDRIADLHRLSHGFCYINYFLHGNRSAILSIWVFRGMAFTILLGFEIGKNQSVAIRVREEQRQRSLPQETREEGEIKSTETEDVNLASAGFQLELAKTQTEATEGIMEVTDVEKGLLEVQGMVEKQDALTDDVMKDIDMEMDAINANLLKNGMDMEAEDEFQTLSEEEAEQALGDQIVHTHAQEEEELGNGDGALNDDTGAGDMGTRQSSRKRLFKPPISTAGSNKMRMASALLSPRKRAVAKGGSRQGDSSKQLDNKGPSNPKPANLKF
ncbi:hypothetical protein HID58_089575, partial [Brassica napus]